MQLIFEFPPPPQNPQTNLVGPVVAGGGIGWLSGVFGIGGGIFSVPYFYHRGLKMMNAIGLLHSSFLDLYDKSKVQKIFLRRFQKHLIANQFHHLLRLDLLNLFEDSAAAGEIQI